MSDLPSHLIQFISTYRTKHKTDANFDATLSLFANLSSYSMKGKNLVAFFQNLSPLPGASQFSQFIQVVPFYPHPVVSRLSIRYFHFCNNSVLLLSFQHSKSLHVVMDSCWE